MVEIQGYLVEEGDKNTSFFHHTATLWSSINTISKIKVDEEWVFDSSRIGDHIEEYYKTLYYEPFSFSLVIEDVEFDCVDDEL